MEPVVDGRTYSGRYEVTHLIARGGMAQVYRALDTRLGRHVALKVLFPELSVDRTFVERFRREAQAAANLSHPNIVAVYDWGGEDDGAYFIAMELITGDSLATTLRAERTTPATRAASIAAHVASALSYAHRHGVVHRDIKPGNVLLTEDGGQVKVTDFGIAQAVSTEEGLTMAGSVMGTAAYFSPEQAEGAVVDGRSDLYSLGVVLYEMLAGRPPFVGDSPVAVASMHVRNAPPLLRDLNPAVPEALEQITMRALSKSPDDRYQTAEEMREDLVRFSEGRPVLAGAALTGSTGTTTSVMGAATATSVLPQKDTTIAVPVVAALPVEAAPPPPPKRVDRYEDDDDEVAPRRQGAPAAVWIAIVLGVALVLVGLFAYRTLVGSSGLTVPNVKGESIQQAKATLSGLGLSVKDTILRNSPEAVGTVLNVSPPVGHPIKAHGSVVLVTSRGPFKPVTVPAVVGQNLETASTDLTTVGLVTKVAYVSSWNSPVVQNTVIAQSPLGLTTANSGSTVTLTFLSSTGTFPMPSLASDGVAQAGAALGKYGLVPGSTSQQVCSSSIAQGNVVSTSPTAGSTVAAGETVSLTLSSGACPVQVPDVIAETIAAAESTLTGDQLQPVVEQCTTSGGVAPGTIALQDPQARSSVTPGTPVDITPECASTGPTGPTGPS